jgi:hypothetical protein
MDRIIGTFSFGIKGELDHGAMRKILNMVVIGSESCNEYDETGRFLVAKKHPRMEELEKAQRQAPHNIYLDIEYDLTEEGKCINFRVKSAGY